MFETSNSCRSMSNPLGLYISSSVTAAARMKKIVIIFTTENYYRVETEKQAQALCKDNVFSIHVNSLNKTD